MDACYYEFMPNKKVDSSTDVWRQSLDIIMWQDPVQIF